MATDTTGAAGRPIRILRALAERPGGLSTPELVDLFGEPIRPRQRALTRYGGILRRHLKDGRVEKEWTPGTRPGVTAAVWRATSAARTWLDEQDRAPARAEATRVFAERRREQNRRAAVERAEALAAARSSYGRDTPPFVRVKVARDLRNLGCTLEQVGAALGVSRETIRLDLLADAPGLNAPQAERHISFGRAGSVTVIVNVRSWLDMPDDLALELWRLIKEIEGLADSGT